MVIILSRAVIRWLLTQLNMPLTRLISETSGFYIFDPRIAEELEEFIFQNLSVLYGAIGAVDYCSELERILREEIKDERKREYLIQYVRYLVKKFFEYLKKKKMITEVEAQTESAGAYT